MICPTMNGIASWSPTRLLLLEEHYQRLLVHAGAVRDAEEAQQPTGADADYDAGQQQGGAGL